MNIMKKTTNDTEEWFAYFYIAVVLCISKYLVLCISKYLYLIVDSATLLLMMESIRWTILIAL